MKAVGVVAVSLVLVGLVSAGLKCGDIMSIRSVNNDRFWRTHRSETSAISTAVDDSKNMYIFQCKWKTDMDPVTSGDTGYLKNLESGEYLDDGGAADYSSAMHNHIQTSLSTVNASVVLSPLNEFTIFSVGAATGLNDRSVIINGGVVAFRNRYTRFWTVPDNSNKILSEQYGASPLDKKASFTIDGFCPVVAGQQCSNNGKCDDNRCVCDRAHRGPTCSVINEPAFCHVIGTGNFKSFDGVFFDTSSKGEFLLYSSPDSKDKEAATITMGPIFGAATPDAVGPVAVSVRKGGDIVTIGTEGRVTINCGGDMNLAVKSAGGAGFLTDAGLRIYSTDENGAGSFEVRSNTGLKVVVTSGNATVNAWVHIFEPKIGQLKGMCGDFDGTTNGEMTKNEDNTAVSTAVDKWSLPATQSFKDCGADSQVSFLEIAPAFTGIAPHAGKLTQLIVSKNSIMAKATTEMDRAKLSLHAAIHSSCSGEKVKKSLVEAQKDCASLSVSSSAVALNDYAACLSETCLTGESFAQTVAADSKLDAEENDDKYEGDRDEPL